MLGVAWCWAAAGVHAPTRVLCASVQAAEPVATSGTRWRNGPLHVAWRAVGLRLQTGRRDCECELWIRERTSLAIAIVCVLSRLELFCGMALKPISLEEVASCILTHK